MKRAKRVEAAQASGLVLDTGALMALEGSHLELFAALEVAHDRGLPIRIPAGALAQAWRGGPRNARLARLLKQSCAVVVVDEPVARQIGEFIGLIGKTEDSKPDVVDAHVALTTRATKSLLWTSDPDDMRHYGVEPRVIRRV